MIDVRKTTIGYLSFTFCGLLLSACGGGGGGTTAPTTPTTPTAKACPPVTVPGDPLYSDQWHLKNTGSPTGTASEDVNVESVWNTLCGSGIIISVVDDGLEIAHEDLAANVLPGGSHNYLNNTNDPSPPPDSIEAHGTSCAGVAAAVGFNGIGVRGAAPGAWLAGYSHADSSADAADAMVRKAAGFSVDVSNNSYGAPDDGGLHPSEIIWQAAINDGITNGRGGKGINYFWAGGNGKQDYFDGTNSLTSLDHSNYDGQANYHGVNAVAALNDDGKQTSYSESGANILISAHAGEFCDTNTITTVDLTGTAGDNNAGNAGTDYTNDNYTQCFNGTSSATPLVAGVAALVLQANPNLTRRDMRLLLAKTARKNDPADGDWTVNLSSGLNINHKYGYGVVDAAAAVNAAASWPLLAAEKTPETYSSGPIAIPIIDSTGTNPVFGPAATNEITVASSAITKLEFVAITFASDHAFWGDLEVVLIGPAGTKSILKPQHNNSGGTDTSSGPDFTAGWRFGSVRHFDETPVGDWQISVRDGDAGADGNITSWSIKLYGR